MIPTSTVLALFYAVFGLTGVALGVTLWLGFTGRRRAHLYAVSCFLVGFVATVGFAEWVGRRLAFDPLAKNVHLPLAIAGSLSVLAPIVTGLRVLRGSGTIPAHRVAVIFFLVFFVAAMGTGIWMLTTGTEVKSAG